MKWGILGAGLFAEDRLAPALNLSRNAELHAVYARDKEKASLFAHRFNVKKYYFDYFSFLSDPAIDIIYVCTPNFRHHEDTLAAIQAGKHVFCEKPMTTSLDKAYQIQNACEKHQVNFGLAFMFPFHPLSVKAKNWIQEGRIGDILYVKSNFVHDLPAIEKKDNWRIKPEISGGGTIIEVGCHCADILNYLLEKKVKEISAVVNHARWQAPSESVALLNLIFEENILGTIAVSNNIPGAGPYGTNFEIHGTKASIIGIGNLNRNPTGKIILRDEHGKEEIISLPDRTDYQLYIGEIESFSSHIISGSTFYSGLNNSLYNMKIIMSAYESAEQKKTVKI